MSNHIVEENPSAQPATSGTEGADQKVRKQARQLAYDVRYKVKQGFKEGQKADPVSLKRAYLSQLGKSPAPGPVKAAAKKMLVGESYDFVDITDTVKSSVSDVLNSVFTIGGGKKEEEIVEADLGKKFKVRVKDKKTGRSYVRMADRAKISELRKNPNIASVEMTGGAGTPYEGEKKKGAATASVKSGKGIPGDIEKVKEEFIAEVGENENPDANVKKIDVMKGTNKIEVNPKSLPEAKKMTKKQIEKRDEIADAISTREMNKRYGDKNVKYAIATKLAMKKKKKIKEDVSGLEVQNVSDGIKFREYEFIDVVKPEPMRSPKNNITWTEARDEYGDPVDGPKISKKEKKKNLTSDDKDEKITRSEETVNEIYGETADKAF